MHVGWSGNHTHYAERVFTGEQVIGGGELLLPGEVILGAGESYRTPWVYGAYGMGLDAVARRFHRWLRARPTHPSPDRPVTLNVWEAVYFDHDADRLVDLAERAAKLGVERYRARRRLVRRPSHTMPPGWATGPCRRTSGPRGCIRWSTRWSGWACSSASGSSRRWSTWTPTSRGRTRSGSWPPADRWPVSSRFQQVINLGHPDCYAYIRDALLAILDEYPISYLKWDHNRDLIDAGRSPGGEPGVHAQTLATYRLMAELKQAHPGLEIESCSSGGGRVDLGVMEIADRVWVSDCIDPLERQQHASAGPPSCSRRS